MKPAQTLFSLLTLAVAGVGLASGQFITSRTAAPVIAPRNSDVTAAIAARQDTDTVRRTVTRTVIQNSSRSSTSTRPRSSSSTRNNDDDDDNAGTTTRRTSQIVTQTFRSTANGDSTTRFITSPTSTTTDLSTTSQLPSETEPPNNQTESTGLSAGAAAGIAAGTVALVAIIAAAAFLLWRRRQGGIRGAVITADYPQAMTSMSDREPKLPPLPPVGGEFGQQQGEPYPMSHNGGVVVDERRPGSPGVSGETAYEYQIPPAGTMPGEAGFEHPGDDYSYPGQQQEHQQHWPQGPNPADPRPVSAFASGTYPSPGQPALPVSPMTPYRPESSILMTTGQQQQQQQPPPLPLPLPLQQPPRASSYHPSMMMMSDDSPDLPAYLIPGGNRSRAMSFSSVAHFGGGGPHVAQLVGSPPPPSRPSMMVVVEGEEEPVARRSHAGLP